MSPRWPQLVVVAGLLPVLSAWAGDPVHWLLEVSEAARHNTFEGVVVFRDDKMMETLRIAHRHHDGREQERLTSLSGPARDVFREDDHVTCIVDGDPTTEPAKLSGGDQRLFPAMSRETLSRVSQLYDIVEIGEARIAGQACRGVALRPKDGFRYGYEVWADVRTHVPLKVRLTDQQGRMLEEMMFTEVHYPAGLPDARFKPPIPAPTLATDHSRNAAPTLPAWTPPVLPAGFEVTDRRFHHLPDVGGAVEHVLLSDGLSSVSVFRAEMSVVEHVFRGLSSMGAMNAYGRMVGSFHYTVVGEVPQVTVQMIGDGLEPSSEPGG